MLTGEADHRRVHHRHQLIGVLLEDVVEELLVVVLQVTQVDVLVQVLLKLANLLDGQPRLVGLVVVAGREKT